MFKGGTIMKKIILFMVSAFILIGTVRKGSDLLIEKQLNNVENYLVQNGYEVHGVSFDDNTFRVVVKVNGYEDEIVTDASKKNELMFDIQEESIYFNSAMTLSFVIS